MTTPQTTRRNLFAAAAVLTATATLAQAQAQTPAPQRRFVGKVVAITGGNSGIGAATARAFAAEGAKVYFGARREAPGRAIEAEIRAAGGDAAWHTLDVREAGQVEAFVAGAARRYGRLDVLFNNAGIFMQPGELADIALDNYRDMMRTNVDGVFYGMKYALPIMRRQNAGAIVNMASVAAHKGFANTAHYNASKHAVIGLTKAAAVAEAKHGVRINSISPLAVDTPILRESFAFQNLTYAQMAPMFVTPRIMRAEEIAQATLFLASDAASSIAGMDLDVTGGQLA